MADKPEAPQSPPAVYDQRGFQPSPPQMSYDPNYQHQPQYGIDRSANQGYYGPPQQGYYGAPGPQQGWNNQQPPNVVYKTERRGGGGCAGLCAVLACCCCLDMLL